MHYLLHRACAWRQESRGNEILVWRDVCLCPSPRGVVDGSLSYKSSWFSRVPYGVEYLCVSRILSTPSFSWMYSATTAGTSDCQSPPFSIASRTRVPDSRSRSTSDGERTLNPCSRKSRTTRSEFENTTSKRGTRERTWLTQTLCTCVSGIGTMW